MAAGPKSTTRQPRFVSHKERETNAERLRKTHESTEYINNDDMMRMEN